MVLRAAAAAAHPRSPFTYGQSRALHCIPVVMATTSWCFQRLQWIWGQYKKTENQVQGNALPGFDGTTFVGIPPPSSTFYSTRFVILLSEKDCVRVLVCVTLKFLDTWPSVSTIILDGNLLRKSLGLHFRSLKTWRIKRWLECTPPFWCKRRSPRCVSCRLLSISFSW